MKFEFVDIINIILIFQSLVFIFFLMGRRSNRLTGYWEQPNKLLSLFLLIQIFLLINFECFHLQEYVLTVAPHSFYIGTPFFYLAAPVFYFYVRSLAYSDFRFHAADILHAMPFVIVTALFAQQFYFLPSDMKILLVTEKRAFSQTFWIIYNLMFFIQFTLYFIADLRVLKQYRIEIRQQYSSLQRINLSWLNVILYGFILAWLSTVAVFIFQGYGSSLFSQIRLINFLAFFCFLNYIFYKGLSQPIIFSGVDEKPRYETSRLTSDEGKAYLSKLETHMREQKPFLNPTLTLKELAGQISLSPRYLSQIINEYTQQNFYEFVNWYRIEEAKRLLADQSSGRNITEVLYEVGFNSKSSFNTAFKEATGVSPSHYKKHLSSSQSGST